jgi:integrase
MASHSIPGLRPKRAKGRTYWYLERFGSRIAVPAPSDPGFAVALAAAQRGQQPAQRGPRTFRQLIRLYRASPAWAQLAPRTRRDYDTVLEWIGAKIGGLRPEDMKRPHVIRAVQSNAQRVRFANYIRQMLSILCESAISLGWMDHNPAKGVPSIKRQGDPLHKPWPADLVEAFAAAAPPTERTIQELAIGTGQRIGDVLKMRWDHIGPAGLSVRQNKTAARLVIPLTDRLRAYLENLPRISLTIAAGRNGQPLSYDAAAKRIMRVRRKIGAEAFTIHGWRYTAADQLAAAGCSDEEVQAITGHKTRAMVLKYTGSARQLARAESAQSKRAGG